MTSIVNYACLAVVLLVAAITNVVGVHPKLKNIAGSDSFVRQPAVSAADTANGDFYRVRRQNNRRVQYQNSGFRQLVPFLEQLSTKLRGLDNKLMRHEYRDVQSSEFASKTMGTLVSEHAETKTTLELMGKQLAAVEERVMATLTLVAASDERQRSMMDNLSDGLDRLLVASTKPSLGRSPNALPEMPPNMIALAMETTTDISRDVKAMIKALGELNGSQNQRISGVSSEVRDLSDAITEQLGGVSSRQDNLLTAVRECGAVDESKNLVESNGCQEVSLEMAGRLDSISNLQQSQGLVLQGLKKDTQNTMNTQQSELLSLLRELRQESSNNNGSFDEVLAGLQELNTASRTNLGNLHTSLKKVVDENDGMIQNRLEAMETSIAGGQANIMGAIDDSASMTDNLQRTVSDNYDLLSKEIGGLNKIEQVMINTADAVLDTKRSIEFGIQQVIIELSEIVSKSGSTINSTLSEQIASVSFNILKNQTSALTNMTRRMEGEISQVWRQIGIMYQQVEQSINMLDNLQDTTDQHMNVSLSRVGNMDGTVGEINGKVAGVENNLNYLLGRLSLVMSEFNHMKAGIGSELDRLREMAQVSIPNADNKDNLRYNIGRNKRKHAIEDSY